MSTPKVPGVTDRVPKVGHFFDRVVPFSLINHRGIEPDKKGDLDVKDPFVSSLVVSRTRLPFKRVNGTPDLIHSPRQSFRTHDFLFVNSTVPTSMRTSENSFLYS